MIEITDYKLFLQQLWEKHLEPKINTPTFVSLFAGGGGSSLGYSMAGFKELAAVEYNKDAYSCFQNNFTNVPVITQDIRTVSGEDVKTIAGLEEYQLDVLDMSPSCCGFSTAGDMKLDDDRNFLYKEAVRILNVLKPKAFIMENVANMKSKRFIHLFDEVIKSFEESGYHCVNKIVSAKHYGTSTIRKRLFVVGIRNDIQKTFTFPEPIYNEIPVKESMKDLFDTGSEKPLSPLYLEYWNNASYGQKVGKRGSERKLHPDKAGYTIVCGSPIYHWEIPRRISVEEMMRIQGFPEKFQFKNKTQGKHIIGNSVCPPLMYVLASKLKTLLI